SPERPYAPSPGHQSSGGTSRQNFDQPLRIVRRAHLHVVVEEDIDVPFPARRFSARDLSRRLRLSPRAPGSGPRRPELQSRLVIAARIDLLRAVQTDVDEIRGHILEQRPFHAVGHDERHLVIAQQLDELFAAKAWVAHLQRMKDRPHRPLGRPSRLLRPPVVAAGQTLRRRRVTRQQVQKPLEPGSIELLARGKLPQEWAELLLKTQNTRGEEVGERQLHIYQPLHMGDEPAALDREAKAVRCLDVPLAKERRALQRVEGAVYLDRGETLTRILELAPLRQPLGVEVAAPRGISPAGDADAYHDTRQAALLGRGFRVAKRGLDLLAARHL